MEEEKSGYGYGKRPLWQWILIYVVIGGVIYGLVYYFAFGGQSYSYTAPSQSSTGTLPSGQPAPSQTGIPGY